MEQSAQLPPILVIDDQKNMRLSLKMVLADEDYVARLVESAEEGLACLSREEFFMVIVDARLGGMSGYEFLSKARSQWPDLPVLMITAYATPKLAVEAIKLGAIDYIAKPFAPEELLHAVGRCAERYRLLAENKHLRSRTGGSFDLSQIIGTSPLMAKLKEDIRSIAQSNARVLILGESGTGKELIAKALHSLSERRDNALVTINCAAMQDQLAESELFGHEKGAFTGAARQKPGKVETAAGGSLFLDEIGELSLPVQSKLFRFLEDNSFTRVGGTQELTSDVRVIAATNRDLEQAILENKFRPELYHRLNVVQISPPPLRDRKEDIPLLASQFCEKSCRRSHKNRLTVSEAAMNRLLAYDFPGNVRELEHLIDGAVVFCKGTSIQPENLQFPRQRNGQASMGGAPMESSVELRLTSLDLREANEKIAQAAMAKADQNVTSAAKLMGISRYQLYGILNRMIDGTEAAER